MVSELWRSLKYAVKSSRWRLPINFRNVSTVTVTVNIPWEVRDRCYLCIRATLHLTDKLQERRPKQVTCNSNPYIQIETSTFKAKSVHNPKKAKTQPNPKRGERKRKQHLILRQKVEGIGTASPKTSVMCGRLKRFSKSAWYFNFQSGSLKSIASILRPSLTSMEAWILPKCFLELRLRNLPRLKPNSPGEQCDTWWWKPSLGPIECDIEPIRRRSARTIEEQVSRITRSVEEDCRSEENSRTKKRRERELGNIDFVFQSYGMKIRRRSSSPIRTLNRRDCLVFLFWLDGLIAFSPRFFNYITMLPFGFDDSYWAGLSNSLWLLLLTHRTKFLFYSFFLVPFNFFVNLFS